MPCVVKKIIIKILETKMIAFYFIIVVILSIALHGFSLKDFF